MGENIKKKIINWGVSGSMMLSTALYSSMSFAYRLDKNIEISSINYDFMTNALLDIINVDREEIKYKFKTEKEEYHYSFFDSNESKQIVLYNDVLQKVKLSHSVVIKKGDCNSIYNSGVVGINSAILSLGDLFFSNGNIKTFGEGAKGFYQKGLNTKGVIFGSEIETHKDRSNAIEVAEHGELFINKTLIYTSGENSGGVCVSANSKCKIDNSDIFIINDNSPALYINGQLIAKKSLIQTEGSYLGVIEGESDVFLIDNSLRGRQGFKMMNKSIENGFKIKIGINKGYIRIEKGFLFDIENISTEVNLSNVDITLKENNFIRSVSNKHNEKLINTTKVNMNNTSITGKIITDDLNKLELIFHDNVRLVSSFIGNVSLSFKEDNYDQLILSDNSYVDQIQISDNNIATLKKIVNLNGNILYYKSSLNNWLKNKDYYFEDGSSLIAI